VPRVIHAVSRVMHSTQHEHFCTASKASVFVLLYQYTLKYKRTNTSMQCHISFMRQDHRTKNEHPEHGRSQFTCFTSTNIQILTQLLRMQCHVSFMRQEHSTDTQSTAADKTKTAKATENEKAAATDKSTGAPVGTQFTCFTSTNVQILTQLLREPPRQRKAKRKTKRQRGG